MAITLELTIADPVMLDITTEPPLYINTRPQPATAPEVEYDEYPDDETAKDNGLEVGDWYIFSEDSDVGPHGTLKRIMT